MVTLACFNDGGGVVVRWLMVVDGGVVVGGVVVGGG